MVRQQRAVIDTTKAAGVSQVVRISAAGANETADRTINRWHGELDAYLQSSGMACDNLESFR